MVKIIVVLTVYIVGVATGLYAASQIEKDIDLIIYIIQLRLVVMITQLLYLLHYEVYRMEVV